MLANLNDVLIPAKKGKYAVGLFNSCSMEEARGVIAAAEETHSPVIFGTAEILLPFCPMENVADMLVPMAKRASVPVVIHYDHGLTYEQCLKALKLGFTSIMYDCSGCEYEENVEKMADMVKIAHCFGATVEGELGSIGANGKSIPSDFYTDPQQAKDFVMRTGVDALAIAVGTVHGEYKLPPKLDFDRIKEIAKAVSVPLVLHGGSGLSVEDFHKAIDCGISKINIFTDLDKAGAKAAVESYNRGNNVITKMNPDIVEGVKAEVMKKMLIFKNNK